MYKAKSEFDRAATIFIFVTHRWLSPGGASGHPDDMHCSKFKLIVQAVEWMLCTKHMKKTDYGMRRQIII